MKTSSPTTPIRTPLKILLIGPPGSRKSTLMLQIPGIYVEDCDRLLHGPETWLRDPKGGNMPNLSYGYNDLRYLPDGKPRDVDDCYNALCDDLKLIHSDPKQFEAVKVVGTDSLSQVNEFIIRHVLKLQNKTKKNYEMEARDWIPFKSFAYSLLVSRLEETGKHVLCTCHETKLVESDPSNMMLKKVLGYEPFFQGSVGDIIGAFFSDVWRVELRKDVGDKLSWVLQTTRAPKCEVLKNSLNMPAEIQLKTGWKDIEPYLKGRI